MRSLRDLVLIAFGAIGILALARQAMEPDDLEAVAIPNAQEDVETVGFHFTDTNFILVPNSVVTINNGTQTRRVVIQFSAEAATLDINDIDGIELGYALNNGGGSVCFPQAGPLLFAQGRRFHTHTAIHVPTLGPGTWTIQPCVRVVNPDSDNDHVGTIGIRTLTAEVLTK